MRPGFEPRCSDLWAHSLSLGWTSSTIIWKTLNMSHPSLLTSEHLFHKVFTPPARSELPSYPVLRPTAGTGRAGIWSQAAHTSCLREEDRSAWAWIRGAHSRAGGVSSCQMSKLGTAGLPSQHSRALCVPRDISPWTCSKDAQWETACSRWLGTAWRPKETGNLRLPRPPISLN